MMSQERERKTLPYFDAQRSLRFRVVPNQPRYQKLGECGLTQLKNASSWKQKAVYRCKKVENKRLSKASPERKEAKQMIKES